MLHHAYQAQEYSMTYGREFTFMEEDLDARVNFPEKDRNGKLCALIKVTVINELKNPLTLSIGTTLEVVRMEDRKNGEVWFYIPAEARNLEFRCRGYQPIKIPVPFRLNPGGVYRITITANTIGTYIQSAVITSNYLKVNINPENAVFSIGRTQEYEIASRILNDGNFSMLLDYGEYYYKIEHEFYKTMTGTLKVDSDVSIKYIEMEPAYSYLDVNTIPSGADIQVNGKFIGVSPLKIPGRLKEGEISIRAYKDMYYPVETTVHIPGDTLRHSTTIPLQPQFGTVTCTCDDSEAELWIDKQYVGTGTWTGYLSSSSSHYLEAKKKGHLSQSMNFEVKDGETVTLTIAGPEPLYGTIEVISEPSNATVKLDGETIGTTPFIRNNIVTEDHIMEVTKEGYKPYRDTIFINHNQHLKLNCTLEKGYVEGYISISTDQNANIFAGNRHLGKGQWSGYLPVGTYVLRSSREGYNDGSTTVTINGEEKINITVPSPTQKTGKLRVTSNINGASIHLRNSDTDQYLFGQTTPHTFSIAPGQYSIYLSKSGYDDSEKQTVNIRENSLSTVRLKLKKSPVRFYMSRHFMEITYGYGFGINNVDAVSTNYVGINYGYLKSRIGLHTSMSYGLEHKDISLSIGPAVRLSKPLSDLDVQIYAAPCIRYDQNTSLFDPTLKHNRWHLMGDAGIRFNFDNLSDSDLSWTTLSLGCKFSANSVIPTAGISIFPVALAMADEELGFASHFLDLNTGYDLNGEILMGAGYSWIQTHLGVYGSFLIGMKNTSMFTVAAGPVVRLTTDYSSLDLQLYGGPAYIYNEFGGDFGIRFGWESNTAVSMWDFSIGCLISGSHVIPTVSLGIGISLIGGIVLPAIVYSE